MFYSIKTSLTGGRIEKIFGLDKGIIIKIYNRQETNLLFSTNPPYFSLINDYPRERNNFSDLLKKYIEQGYITNVSVANDRVLKITISGTNQLYQKTQYELYYLIIGRQANIILCKDNYIVESLNKVIATSVFNIGAIFSFTEHNPSIAEIIHQRTSLSNIVKRALTTSTEEAIINVIENASKFNIDEHNDFHILPLTNAQSVNFLNGLPSHFMHSKKKIDNSFSFIYKLISSAEAKKSALELELHNNQELTKYKDIGNAIYKSGLPLNNFADSISDEENTYQLNSAITLKENAELSFKKYNKYKAGEKKLTGMIEEAEKQLIKLKEQLWQLESCDGDEAKELLKSFGYKVKSKKNIKPIAPFNTFIIDKTIIRVGKNKKGNNLLTFKKAGKKDHFFHIANGSGSHVVVSGEINNEIIKVAAEIAAYYSSYRLERMVSVYYCRIQDVKKGQQAGEVNLLNYQTISITPNSHDDIKKTTEVV